MAKPVAVRERCDLKALPAVPLQDITLTRMPLHACGLLSSRFGPGVDLRLHIEDVAHRMVLQLDAWLLENKERTIKVSYPADWREALKERFAPAWALRRWPVRWKVHTVEASTLFPKATIKIPELGQPTRVMVYDETELARCPR
jgi:hypothetical protein